MATKKIKLDNDIFDKAKTYADAAGYSSVDEFILHIIEKELGKIEEGGETLEEVEKRLKGLGYIS